EVRDTRQGREVPSLTVEIEVVGQRDRLAFHQRLTGHALVAPSGGGREESLEIHAAVLEDVDELVRERVPSELGRQPVRENHPCGRRIVVGRRLLSQEVGQEAREVEVGGYEAPGRESALLRVESRRGILPRELGRHEATPLLPALDHERGRGTG